MLCSGGPPPAARLRLQMTPLAADLTIPSLSSSSTTTTDIDIDDVTVSDMKCH